jgi:DNA repair protein RadD
VTDIHHEELDDGRERHKAKPRTAPLPKECPQCAFLKPPRVTTCPACGFKPIAQSKIECEDGELRELTPAPRRGAEMSREEQALFFGQSPVPQHAA